MIVVAGHVVATEANRAEMLRLSLEHVRRSRAEPGCLEHGVYVDAENPLKLHFFERWADTAAIRAHFAVPESRAFAKQLRALAADAGEMHVPRSSARETVMLRDAVPADWPSILALNEESVHFLSPLDDARLAQLAAAATHLRVVEEEGAIAAFLLGFAGGADYDSPNYRWFDSRFAGFLYIDRVVVAPAFRGRRLADRLYDDFEAVARARGIRTILCEVNAEPPNPVSLAFHARRGFTEIGRQPYGEGKTVALLRREIG